MVWFYDSSCPYLQFVNDLHALISPPAKGTPLPLILLGKVCWLLKVALHCSFLNSFSWGWLVLFWSFLIDFLHVFRSRRMQCCQLSSSWIRLCGLGGQEYTRFEDFLLYCHIQEKFDLPGFSPTFCTQRNKENKLAQNSSALMYMLKKSYKKINTTIYMVTNKWLVILIQFLLQNKERAEFLSRIAFYCFLGSNTCTTIIEVWSFPIVLFWVFVWLSGFRHVIVSVHWNNSCLIV